MSKKTIHQTLSHNFRKCQPTFTGRLTGKFATKSYLNIPPHLNYVATLVKYLCSKNDRAPEEIKAKLGVAQLALFTEDEDEHTAQTEKPVGCRLSSNLYYDLV